MTQLGQEIKLKSKEIWKNGKELVVGYRNALKTEGTNGDRQDAIERTNDTFMRKTFKRHAWKIRGFIVVLPFVIGAMTWGYDTFIKDNCQVCRNIHYAIQAEVELEADFKKKDEEIHRLELENARLKGANDVIQHSYEQDINRILEGQHQINKEFQNNLQKQSLPK